MSEAVVIPSGAVSVIAISSEYESDGHGLVGSVPSIE